MEINIPIVPGFSLKLDDLASSQNNYPTSRLQKGFLLNGDGQELAEEGVGFGVPILKRGIHTIFPGHVEFTSRSSGSVEQVAAKFTLNLEEKIGRPGFGTVKSQPVYTIKNFLAALIRRIPGLRGALTGASNALRRLFSWETTFEESGFQTYVDILYTIDSRLGIINIEVDLTDLAADELTEFIVMNEQGARHFDMYQDASGILLRGNEIGCWDEVTAEWASFLSSAHKLAFTIEAA